MPELPDVEIFAKNLNKLLAGKKLNSIKVVNGKKLQDSQAALTKALKGKKLKKIYRAGKEMRFLFSDDILVGLHLMLTGDIFIFDKKNDKKSTIVELHFEGDVGLAFTDRMRNANIKLDPVDKDGVDAISPELNFKYLQTVLDKRKTSIKKLMTDQNIIRGIGNSYSDEILWTTRIHPNSVAGAIPKEKIKELAAAIKKRLKFEIKQIDKHYPGNLNGEIKDFMQIHTKLKDKSPAGAPIIIEKKGMMKTYFTKEQVLYK